MLLVGAVRTLPWHAINRTRVFLKEGTPRCASQQSDCPTSLLLETLSLWGALAWQRGQTDTPVEERAHVEFLAQEF